jgi:hypothetical protein
LDNVKFQLHMSKSIVCYKCWSRYARARRLINDIKKIIYNKKYRLITGFIIIKFIIILFEEHFKSIPMENVCKRLILKRLESLSSSNRSINRTWLVPSPKFKCNGTRQLQNEFMTPVNNERFLLPYLFF